MSRRALDWSDPEACASWLAALASAAHDLGGAAEDQTRAPAERDLGRRAARAIVTESSSAIDSLIAFARAGLPHGDPSGNGDHATAKHPQPHRPEHR
jgi:hypothetical protein